MDTTYNLGTLFANGKGEPKDESKARERYAKADAAGLIKATYNLPDIWKQHWS